MEITISRQSVIDKFLALSALRAYATQTDLHPIRLMTDDRTAALTPIADSAIAQIVGQLGQAVQCISQVDDLFVITINQASALAKYQPLITARLIEEASSSLLTGKVYDGIDHNFAQMNIANSAKIAAQIAADAVMATAGEDCHIDSLPLSTLSGGAGNRGLWLSRAQ